MNKLLISGCVLLAACARAEEHHHVHKAPHGGALIALGEHFAHVEIVLDPTTGALTAYVLDGEAEGAVRIKQNQIVLAIDRSEISLTAVGSVLTGETAGDTSQFSGTSPLLKGRQAFKAKIVSLTVHGKECKDVEFGYPQGNEHHDGSPE